MSTITDPAQSASEQRVNFLNLMITQLRNQNPLEPMDNNEMASQLAQLSQLDQAEQMNASFKNVLLVTEANYASSLIGKQVSYLPNGEETAVRGRVSGMEQSGGEVFVTVGTARVAVKNVLSVAE